MGIAGSTARDSSQSKTAKKAARPGQSLIVVNHSKKTGNTADFEKRKTTNAIYDMGTRAAKEKVKQESANNDEALVNAMNADEKHMAQWRLQMTALVDKLQKEIVDKDAKLSRLADQARQASDRYNSLSQPIEQSRDDVIQTLKARLKVHEERIKEKEAVIRSLQRQLMQSRNDKESQVSVVKDTVEMVIREKDSEIRRLKALWGTSDQIDQVDGLDEVNKATKLLNTNDTSSNTRFGISAENRSSNKSLHVEAVPKTTTQVAQIKRALNSNVFLKGLDANQVEQLMDCMSLQTVSAGSEIIAEGEYGTHMYVLDKGQVEVYHKKSGERSHVIDLNPGTVFGELAILYNCKRTAYVEAKTDVTIWSIDRQLFQTVVKKSGQSKRDEYVRLLRTVDRLKSLSENKLLRIADCLEQTTFRMGDYIIRQGDSGDTFYVIQEGKVKVTQNKTGFFNKMKSREEDFLCNMEKGEYFGERALLTEDKRAANVIADSDVVTLLMLDRQAFSSLIGSLAEVGKTPSVPQLPLEAEGNSHLDETDGRLRELAAVPEEDEEHVLSEGNHLAPKVTIVTRLSGATESVLKRTKLEDLKVIRILGQGGFGCVKLVQVPGLSNCAFALKAIRQAKIVKTGQQQHVLAEKNIMLAAKSPFIARLYRTYKDSSRIYMLMDAYLGGEMYGVLKRMGSLDETAARFCAGCVLEALSYLHERGIVYRDLKPENLMLDHRGYVKLVDFGFAKRVRFGFKTWTFCGTPEYFPPEILSNAGHDFSADYWSYGILIYELLTRTTPFFAGDDMTVYEGILGGIEGVKFSKRVKRSAELLIRNLCKLEPRDRLGYQKGGVNDIRKHRWFHGFDWQGLRTTSIKSPFKVHIKNAVDTKNFEPCLEELADETEDAEVLRDANMVWAESF
ncbi:cGMP-dependent protein kinase 1-like isoform X1 [Ciona intestinalis]